MKRKGLIFILDGLGDRPCKELNGDTPLEAALTPTLDRLATDNQSGLMDPLMPGVTADTHTGVGILFGLPLNEVLRLRRGPIEAAGIGLELCHDDVFLRANFAYVEKHGDGYHIHDRRAGRITDETASLCAALKNLEVGPGITASLHAATQHRAVLKLHGSGLSPEFSNTDPGSVQIERGILSAQPFPGFINDAQATADAVNCFTTRSHEILAKHPINIRRIEQGLPAANGIISRSAGMYRPIDNLLSLLGMKVAVVAGEMTILGLARIFDFNYYNSPRFTCLPNTDLAEKFLIAMNNIKTHDLVFVHIKGTDIAAHDKDPLLKAKFIERFDTELGKLDLNDLVVGVCADHSTESVSGNHVCDPVPILISHQFGRRDHVCKYNEKDCIVGGLGRITAQGFLLTFLNEMGITDVNHLSINNLITQS